MNYEINFLDVCYPDYFNGSRYPVMAIPLWKNITYSDIKQELLRNDEIWEYGDIEYPGKILYNKELFENAVDLMFDGITLSEIVPTSKELDDDQEDTLYAYFSVKRIC